LAPQLDGLPQATEQAVPRQPGGVTTVFARHSVGSLPAPYNAVTMFTGRASDRRLPAGTAILALLIVITAGVSAGRCDIIALLSGFKPTAPAPDAVAPEQVVELGRNAWVFETVLSKDGRYVYALVGRYGANPVSIAAFHWPELSAVVCIVLWLVAYRRMKGVQRRRPDDGTPFCTGCRYQLTGLTSPTCPECDLELSDENVDRSRPFLMRERCRFFATPFVLSVVCVSAATLFGHIEISRSGSACLPGLYELAIVKGRPLLWGHRQFGEQIARIDLRTGRVQHLTAHLEEGYGQPRLINDDRTLVYLDDYRIKCKDPETGRVQETFPQRVGEIHTTLAVDPTTQQLLASNQSNGFDTWDLRTGEPGVPILSDPSVPAGEIVGSVPGQRKLVLWRDNNL
jgi:hypothetical protein